MNRSLSTLVTRLCLQSSLLNILAIDDGEGVESKFSWNYFVYQVTLCEMTRSPVCNHPVKYIQTFQIIFSLTVFTIFTIFITVMLADGTGSTGLKRGCKSSII